MKKGKLALLLAATSLLLTGCNLKSGKYVVGICQLAPHPALDAATQGFKDELEKRLGTGVVPYSLDKVHGRYHRALAYIRIEFTDGLH